MRVIETNEDQEGCGLINVGMLFQSINPHVFKNTMYFRFFIGYIYAATQNIKLILIKQDHRIRNIQFSSTKNSKGPKIGPRIKPFKN